MWCVLSVEWLCVNVFWVTEYECVLSVEWLSVNLVCFVCGVAKYNFVVFNFNLWSVWVWTSCFVCGVAVYECVVLFSWVAECFVCGMAKYECLWSGWVWTRMCCVLSVEWLSMNQNVFVYGVPSSEDELPGERETKTGVWGNHFNKNYHFTKYNTVILCHSFHKAQQSTQSFTLVQQHTITNFLFCSAFFEHEVSNSCRKKKKSFHQIPKKTSTVPF